MECCLRPETVPGNIFYNDHSCKTWCDVNVMKCGAYSAQDGKCFFCDNVHISPSDSTVECLLMKERRAGITQDKRQCFSNTCLACPEGNFINITHNTSVIFSQKCNRYVPYNSVQESPLISFDFNTSSVPLNGVKMIGPGKVQSTLPIKLGKDMQFLNDIHFFSCKHTNSPAPAALTTSEENAGKVIIEGHVDLASATSLFMTEPKKTGGEIFLDENSSITMTPAIPGISNPLENVGLAALAHVTGFVNLACNSPHEFIVSQSITAARLTSSVENCTVVNLTDLLLDFGREYEVQFFNGPEMPSVATDILTYLLLATAVLATVTFIFNQSKIAKIANKFLSKALKQ